jgi:uncharacterized protein YbaA (DUF1428 family)
LRSGGNFSDILASSYTRQQLPRPASLALAVHPQVAFGRAGRAFFLFAGTAFHRLCWRAALTKLDLVVRSRTAASWLNELMENIMAYVDGFVVPLPKKNIDIYREMAAKYGAIWREHGALRFRECIGDDVKPGKLTSFPQAVNLEPDEVVVFSWIEYESRAHRDEVNDKVMKDPRMAEMMKPGAMPFDGKRMVYGGFEVLVDL